MVDYFFWQSWPTLLWGFRSSNVSTLGDTLGVGSELLQHLPLSYGYSLFMPPKRTVLSCPCWQCEHNWRQDETVLSCLDPVSNFQVFSSPQYIWDWTVANSKLGRDSRRDKTYRNWVATKLLCLVSSCVHTADTDKTILSCLCRRCEQAITVRNSGNLFTNQWHHHITSRYICCCTNDDVWLLWRESMPVERRAAEFLIIRVRHGRN